MDDAKDGKRIALVGCGFFSANHIHAWRVLGGAQLVAVCDMDPYRAAAAAALAGGASAYTDVEHMLDAQRPDILDIVTTAPTHRSLARMCAERGIAAIIQKPLALQLPEALAIAELARSYRISMAVHENFRFQRPMREIKRILDSGIIGELHYCRIAFRSGYDIFAQQPYLREVDRLVLMDNGVHVFDLARFFMGEIESLACATQRVRRDVAGEDMASALLRFASGAMGVVEVSWGSFTGDDPFPETLVVIEGSEGSLTLDRGYRLAVHAKGVTRLDVVEPAIPSWGERPWHVVQDSVTAFCRHWLQTADEEREPETTVADNVRTLAAVEACYLSSACGGAMTDIEAVLRSAAASLAAQDVGSQ